MTAGSSAGARAAIGAGELSHEAVTGASGLQQIAKYGTVAGLMGEAGEAATKAIGLSPTAGYIARVGSNVVRQAAETAALQVSDEASKMVADDKNAPATVENALANVGLAAAIGGAAGGIWTGAVSPLWKATVGNKVAEFLQASKYHMDAAGAPGIKNYSGVSHADVAESFGTAGARKLGPSDELRNVANEYASSKGMKLNQDLPTLTVDPERSAAIAKAYDDMVHAPNDPKVRKAYNALAKETMDQWQFIKNTGLTVEAIEPGVENPYKNSTDMINDVRNNKHMWYYPTSQGFGSGDTLPKNFSMISSQVGDVANPAAHEALKNDLIKMGYKISESAGNYGGTSEPSFLVEHNGSAASKAALADLGKKYGQESILHSAGNPGTRLNELAYTDGRPSVTGFGVEQNPNAVKDFTDNPTYGKFSLKFDKEAANVEHPLLAYTPELINGKPAQLNDIFRIVHDYFGHAKEGFGFGPKGEENAWHHHMQMFSPEARKALTSETRGQNSWVNFGPKGDANRANPAATTYAEQKAGILPAWTRDTTNKPVTSIKVPFGKKHLETTQQFLADQAGYAGTAGAYQAASGEDESPVSLAARFLGVEVTPVMRAAMSGEPKAVQLFNELREAQHPEVVANLKDLPGRIDKAVAAHLGVPLEDAAHYSDHAVGSDLQDTMIS